MALFSKKLKKKNEPAGDENTIPVQWKVYNNRESFSLILNGNLLLLYEASNTIYACMDYNNQPFDEFQPAVIMDATDFMK